MRKPFLVLVLVCLTTALAAAQAPPASVCEVHINKVKPGMTAQYEAGRAKHMAWHKSQNDRWSWETWEITTGENTGNYLIASCGHTWKDFDAREKFNVADSANANATMGNALAGETMTYYTVRPDLGTPSKTTTPPAYLSVIHFHLKPEGIADFNDSVKKISSAMSKADDRPSTWYSLANGGRGPEAVLVQERKSIGDLASSSPKTMEQILQEAYGEQGATILNTVRKGYYSSNSELLHFRPDLSYMAPAAK
ncbi:MAG: hypothetical protein ACR2IF_10785 [Terriglobales bacterium]